MRTVTPAHAGGRADHRSSHTAAGQGIDDKVAAEVREELDERPWVVTLTRLGWLAKGVVYVLMGVAAVSIARGSAAAPAEGEEASPQGALDTIRDTSGGRALLGVLCVGLLLYVAWRVLSVALQRGNDARHWLNRIGYSFSAVFYLTLALIAGRAAMRGDDPGQSTQIEDLSQRTLDMTAGRWLLGLAGVVVIVVGLVFVVERGVLRRFTRDLNLGGASEAERKLIISTGVVGWIGRGIVTVLVGWFVLRAALDYDPQEARGFDLALREVADTTRGEWLVLGAGIGLIAYGIWCGISARRQALRS